MSTIASATARSFQGSPSAASAGSMRRVSGGGQARDATLAIMAGAQKPPRWRAGKCPCSGVLWQAHHGISVRLGPGKSRQGHKPDDHGGWRSRSCRGSSARWCARVDILRCCVRLLAARRAPGKRVMGVKMVERDRCRRRYLPHHKDSAIRCEEAARPPPPVAAQGAAAARRAGWGRAGAGRHREPAGAGG